VHLVQTLVDSIKRPAPPNRSSTSTYARARYVEYLSLSEQDMGRLHLFPSLRLLHVAIRLYDRTLHRHSLSTALRHYLKYPRPDDYSIFHAISMVIGLHMPADT
jgi:hypothetical protein